MSKKAIEKLAKEIKKCEEFVEAYHSQKIITDGLVKANLTKISQIQMNEVKIQLQSREINNLRETNEKLLIKSHKSGQWLPTIAIVGFILGVVISK